MKGLNSKKAFTLVEVLSSILLISALMMVVIQIAYGNNRRAKKVKQLRKIEFFLESKMLSLDQEFSGSNTIQLPKQAEGEFDEKGYTWFYETKVLELPPKDVLLSLLSLPDNEMNNQWLDVLSNLISNSVVELKLTVSYTPVRGKSLSYSLSSYFVNYESAPGFILSQISSKISVGAGAL